MLGQIILIVLVIWMVVIRWQKRGMIKLWNQLKNNYKILPFIGHAYMFLGNDEDRMKVFQRLGMESMKTGGMLALWQGTRLYVMVSDPELAEILLKTCLEKDDVMRFSRLLTGNGSIFAPVPIWRPRRKFLAPTFSPKNLTQFVDIFSQQSTIMVEKLKAVANTGTFSLWKYITTYSMDSVCETTLGVRVNAQQQCAQPFLIAFEEICKLDSARICQPWLHNDTVFKMLPRYRKHAEYRHELCGFIDQVIKKKRQKMKQENVKNKLDRHTGIKTFLELLIESTGGDRGYTNLELQEETLVLVLAGTDTSAVGAAFTAVMMSRHPDVQDKVYEELKEVFGDSDRPLVADDLSRLKYLEAVIRETIRLYPPVPVIVRKATKDVKLPAGITLVKDCGIVINIWAIHRNPKYWGTDLEQFKPERFIENPLKHPAAFMPFSHGPRACVGYQYAMMSMKTAMAALLRQYRVMPTSENGTYKNKPLRVKFDVMMKPVDNFSIQLERRT